MLIVAGEVVVDEGAVERAREILCTMERETRKEAGCLAYAFSVDISDPTLVRIFEQWESMEALEAHFATPHMQAFRASISVIQPRSMQVKAYDVAGEVALPG